MNKRASFFVQVMSLVMLAALPALAAGSRPSYMPGLTALGPLWMYWLCNSQKHKSIGGWLLYFYIQIYVGVPIVFGAFLIWTLPHLQANRWHDQTAFALFTLKSILPLVMITAQAIMATVLLKKREWAMVNLLRGLFVADLLSAVFALGLDWIYWPSAMVSGMLGLLWPAIWLGYFGYSKRVERVFKTHDWETALNPGLATEAARPEVLPLTGQAPTSPQVELCFTLTPEEFDEGISTLRSPANHTTTKYVMRLICGVGAYFLWHIPASHGQTWQQFFQTEPVFAIWLAVLIVFDGLIVLGVLNSPKLNRLANRLDWERRIRFSDNGVDVNWGKRMNFHYRWQDLLFFQETPGLFILKAGGTQFWTMPKRAIPAGAGENLRALLSSRLPRK